MNTKMVKRTFIVLFILNLVFLDLIALKNKLDYSNAINIFEGLIALVNLIIIIIFYLRDAQNNKDNDSIEVKRYWYHELIIGKNIDKIIKMYNVVLEKSKEISNVEDVSDLKCIFSEIKLLRKDVMNTFYPLLFSFDQKIYKDFSEKIVEFEDVFTNCGMKLLKEEISLEEYNNELNTHLGVLYKLLFGYDLNNNKL